MDMVRKRVEWTKISYYYNWIFSSGYIKSFSNN
uniref:Uncharacterized protein n=1 Tax=Rhizophora mucronata TaxID=61149 RepID=A0A2P2J423_RHIMU